MDSEVPPTEALPAPSASWPGETAHDRHTQEFEHSLEVLEGTVEHGLVRMLKIAVPALIGVVLLAVASYVLGGYLKDRAEQKRIARALRRSRRKLRGLPAVAA